jgi:hypothetical protein
MNTCFASPRRPQWFPELHRAYALRGAELLVFPSAIGAELSAPDLDTSEAWQLAMRGQAVANGIFVAAINRVTPPVGGRRGGGGGEPEPGTLGGQRFFGRSFCCGPDGAVLCEAGQTGPVVVTAALDLGQVRTCETTTTTDIGSQTYPHLTQSLMGTDKTPPSTDKHARAGGEVASAVPAAEVSTPCRVHAFGGSRRRGGSEGW